MEVTWITENEKRLDRLFTQLDASHPDLSDCIRNWDTGERVKACQALVEYFRRRPVRLAGLEPTLTFPTNAVERADAFLEGQWDPLRQLQPIGRREDGGIDWNQRGRNNDKEFAWALNRQLFLADLLAAARETEDPVYLKQADTVLADWVRANPYPNRLTFSAPWRALEVARRLLEIWGPYFDELRAETALRDETLLLFLSSIPEHADALLEHASVWGGNHLVTEKTALVLAGLQWPEFRDAQTWRDEGIRAATGEIMSQTYPDGAYMELSNHYHLVVLRSAQHLAELISKSGSEPPAAFQQRLFAMWDYFAGVMKPDGSGPLNNAADREDNAAFVRAIARRDGRADWLYQGSRTREGTAPAETHFRFFRWAGQAVFRDDWSPQSRWAFFDVGPYGSAHQHDDALHLSVYLEGRDFLVDAGRYTYQPGPWKDYFTGPIGHNVLTLKGYERRARPFKNLRAYPATAQRSAEFTILAGDQWFDATAEPKGRSWRQRRFVVHAIGKGFVIVDRLTGFGPAEASFHWHFAPSQERDGIDSQFFQWPAPSPATTRWTRGSEHPVRGWRSRQYGEIEAGWQRDDTWRIEGPTTVAWLIGFDELPTLVIEGHRVTITLADSTTRCAFDLEDTTHVVR